MLKLVELGNYHSFEGVVFEMVSNRGDRLETLHWSVSFSSLFIEKYSDCILIDGTPKINIYDLSLVDFILIVGHKTNIYYLSLVVATMVYRVVKKARNLQYGDATDCIPKLVEL